MFHINESLSFAAEGIQQAVVCEATGPTSFGIAFFQTSEKTGKPIAIYSEFKNKMFSGSKRLWRQRLQFHLYLCDLKPQNASYACFVQKKVKDSQVTRVEYTVKLENSRNGK